LNRCACTQNLQYHCTDVFVKKETDFDASFEMTKLGIAYSQKHLHKGFTNFPKVIRVKVVPYHNLKINTLDNK
jgi:hypothetical protein